MQELVGKDAQREGDQHSRPWQSFLAKGSARIALREKHGIWDRYGYWNGQQGYPCQRGQDCALPSAGLANGYAGVRFNRGGRMYRRTSKLDAQ